MGKLKSKNKNWYHMNNINYTYFIFTVKLQRFHTLIGLMLSSQTKDAVTHAAITRLKNYGLTVDNILKTSQEDIEKLIYPVGFYKVTFLKLWFNLLINDFISNSTPISLSEVDTYYCHNKIR